MILFVLFENFHHHFIDGIFTLNWSFIPLPIILFHMHAYTHLLAQPHFSVSSKLAHSRYHAYCSIVWITTSLIYIIFLYCYRGYNHFWMVYLVICHVQLKLIIMPLTNLIRRRRYLIHRKFVPVLRWYCFAFVIIVNFELNFKANFLNHEL